MLHCPSLFFSDVAEIVSPKTNLVVMVAVSSEINIQSKYSWRSNKKCQLRNATYVNIRKTL